MQKTWAPRGQTPVLKVAGKWTKISAISALSASAIQRRVSLYIRFHVSKNIRHPQVLVFLQHLLQHLRRGFVLLWDSGSVHKAGAVKKFLERHASIHAYFFPGYAPELNADEFVWGHLKRSAANGIPKDIGHLRNFLYGSAQKLKRSKNVLRGFLRASELPWE